MKTIKNLMIIDDDLLFVFLAKKSIGNTDMTENILVHNNGLDALDDFKSMILQEDPIVPELIFLDLSMPIMDGWQFLERFTKLPQSLIGNIKIYVVSSSISPDDLERARAVPFVVDFIIKPITKEKLLEVVRQYNYRSKM